CPTLYRAYRSKLRPLQEGAELSLEKIVASAEFDAKAALKSEEAALRFAAVFGLSPQSEEGLHALSMALKDKDAGVRLMAVTRLGSAPARFADTASKAVESIANDGDSDVRNQLGYSERLLASKRTKTAPH